MKQTVPLAPERAEDVFRDRLPIAVRYAELLCDTGVSHGLIGPREVDRIWERHILNCAALAEIVPPDRTVCDVGSGAGLPGIPLAIARPDLQVCLIEPLERRTRWLVPVVSELGIPVRVLRSKAQDCEERFDVAVSRAVAPLSRLVTWCLPLLSVGGEMLAIKGRSASQEITAARRELTKYGAENVEVVVCGDDQEPTTVIRVRV